MIDRSKQIAAGILALTAVDVGAWAEFAPKSFYDSFPGLGHHWVSTSGPYDEHLVRDVGGLYLALFAISVWAAVRPRRETFALVGLGWLVFSIPHFVFHMIHLDDQSGAADKAGNVIALGGTIVLAALLLLPARTRRTA